MNAKKLTLSKFDFERGISAEFRYTTSRGVETYGYNICTLYINGKKVSSCMGGGYDMRGTALGKWIEVQWPDELKTLQAGTDKMVKDKNGHEYQKRSGFYGLHFWVEGEKYGTRAKYKKGAKVSLDGGCGINCMEDILKAIGYSMTYIRSRKKNEDISMIMPVQVTK